MSVDLDDYCFSQDKQASMHAPWFGTQLSYNLVVKHVIH